MKNLLPIIRVMAMTIYLAGCGSYTDPSSWNVKKTDEWFSKGEWRNGWNKDPDSSVDRQALAVSYSRNKERWDAAFSFLKNSDLATMETGRHDIDGDNLYAIVSEYNTKNVQDADFEAHRKYTDIQYVVKGREIIGIASLTSADTIRQEYDPAKDIEFMTVKEEKFHTASPGNFFIFFPGDAHKPGLKTDTVSPVRKIVIKVRIDL